MIDIESILIVLRDRKRASGIVPECVLYTDLQREVMLRVNEELNRLYAEEKISVNMTLNGKSINILT